LDSRSLLEDMSQELGLVCNVMADVVLGDGWVCSGWEMDRFVSNVKQDGMTETKSDRVDVF
jgi:hypothetical protein